MTAIELSKLNFSYPSQQLLTNKPGIEIRGTQVYSLLLQEEKFIAGYICGVIIKLVCVTRLYCQISPEPICRHDAPDNV